MKREECAKEISSCFICFTQQMKVIINCGKSDILKSKQVLSLVKWISNKFFQCLQSSPPASTRSLQLPFVSIDNSSFAFLNVTTSGFLNLFKKLGKFRSVTHDYRSKNRNTNARFKWQHFIYKAYFTLTAPRNIITKYLNSQHLVS